MNKELKQKVIQWSKDRGIIDNGKPLTQFAKLMSEFSEIFEAKRLNDEEKLIDAIGDVQVVLINLSEMLGGVNFEKTNNFYDLDLLTETICNIGDMIIKEDKNAALTLIRKSYIYLVGYARYLDINSDYALEIAYNEIKDRKGFLTPEGNFVKDTDPRYNEIIKRYKG
jgi:hypothetical protein